MVGTSTPHRVERVEGAETAQDESVAVPVAETAALYALHAIRTPDQYDRVLKLIAALLREPHEEGSFGYDILEVLSILVQAYDQEHMPDLGTASPQEVVQFMADQRGMKAADLALLLGGRSRLSEFMNGKRGLSLAQVRSLREELGIPADLLIA